MSEMKPGRELDALIAEKVMGWHKGSCGECKNRPWLLDDLPCSYWHDEKGEDTKNPINDIWSGGMSDSLDVKAWSPSTNIKDAWEVVERLATLGWNFERLSAVDTSEFPFKMICRVSFFLVDQRKVLCNYKLAEKTPYAICKVALKAVENKND